MRQPRRRRFLFNDSAIGFNGLLKSPRHERIEGQAAAALSVSGGVSSSRVEKIRLGEFVSIDAATAAVAGGKVDIPGSKYRVAEASARASLEGFNMLDVVRAEHAAARIAAEHPEEPHEEPRITLLGTGFEGLSIAGRRVEIVYNDCLFELQQFSDLKRNKAAFELLKRCWLAEYREFGRSDFTGRSLPKTKDQWLSRLFHGGPVLCPIVKEVRNLPPGVEADGHILYIPSFGELHLGELFFTATARSLTMMRFELGCCYSGCSSGGGISDNGSWHP